MATALIIQARLGSTRFPKKMLAQLGNDSLINWVLKRCSRVVGASKVILATTQKPEDDELVDAAYSLGIECFRGSEDDVLSQYAAAWIKQRVHVNAYPRERSLTVPPVGSGHDVYVPREPTRQTAGQMGDLRRYA